MQLPFFFEENISADSGRFTLSEVSSKHIVQVLRMNEEEQILITNGKGESLIASIILASKKKTEVNIISRTYCARQNLKVSIAISLIKTTSRFEWFLEKATEIGASEIIPLICDRTEKHQVKWDRMRTIVISAMLQSRQKWIPEIRAPIKFSDLIKNFNYQQKFIAHCYDGEKRALNNFNAEDLSRIILIGPEGDFTENEIKAAIENNYIPISLGETRLRTETAGIVAAVLLLNK